MAYTWTDGELITAEKLNETGSVLLIKLESFEEVESGTLYTYDKTWQEVYDALNNGVPCYVFSIGYDGVYMSPVLSAFELPPTSFEVEVYNIEGALVCETAGSKLTYFVNDGPGTAGGTTDGGIQN